MFRGICRLAARAPGLVGSPWVFVGAVCLTLLWLATGPLFDWSSNWILWPATVTSVGAFLLVLLLQYSQNRDMRVLQVKLDELLRSFAEARTHLVRLEQVSDQELEQIEQEFRALREEAARD